MNKTMLSKLKYQRVGLRPQPRELNRESRGQLPRDMIFIVDDVSEEGLTVRDRDSGVTLLVRPDHIREYLSGGRPEPTGETVGFLHLKVQWTWHGDEAKCEPIFGGGSVPARGLDVHGGPPHPSRDG